MTSIETFADDAGLIICVERHPLSSYWSASLRISCACSSTIWIKETLQPPLAMDASAERAIEHLCLMCRNKTLVVAGMTQRQIPVPVDLGYKEK